MMDALQRWDFPLLAGGSHLFLDRSSPVPLHYQLYRQLLDRIEQGELKPGDPLPTEAELQEQLQVSRTTVRQAFNRLALQGRIIRRQGQGTFVAPPKLQHSLHRLTSFTEDMISRGLRPSARTLTLETLPFPERPARLLGLPPNTKALRVERVRYADDEPMSLQVVYFPMVSGREISREELEGTGSFYDLLRQKFGLEIKEADETLEAVVADERLAKLLGVVEGSPVLRVERLTWAASGEPVEYVEVFHRGDRYQYYIHLSR